MTSQQRILMRRMVLMADRHATRLSTEEENRQMKPYAISTMVYAAVLNGFVFELFDAVKSELPNPDRYLRIIARVRNNSNYAHEKIYKVFDKNIPNFGTFYNIEHDRVEAIINKNVYLQGGDRLYNIVLALLRITKHYNEKCGRWKSPAICDLYRAERWLTSLNLPYDDKSEAIEAIIRSSVIIQIPDEE